MLLANFSILRHLRSPAFRQELPAIYGQTHQDLAGYWREFLLQMRTVLS